MIAFVLGRRSERTDALTDESARTLSRIVRVLGGKPRPPVLEVVAWALLNGHPDLASEFHLAGGRDARSREARMRLMGFTFDAGGSPLVMDDLILEFNRQARLRTGNDVEPGAPTEAS